MSRCLELERLNGFLYQLLVDVDHHRPPSRNRRSVSKSSSENGSQMDSNSKSQDEAIKPDKGIEKEESYFDDHYELLKIEILKRLKKDLNL